MLTSALYSVRRSEEPTRLWVIPPSSEVRRTPSGGTTGKLQGNRYGAVAKHIADVFFPRLRESKNIRLAFSLDRDQFIMRYHSPKLDLVVSKEVEQVLPAAEYLGRWRA